MYRNNRTAAMWAAFVLFASLAAGCGGMLGSVDGKGTTAQTTTSATTNDLKIMIGGASEEGGNTTNTLGVYDNETYVADIAFYSPSGQAGETKIIATMGNNSVIVTASDARTGQTVATDTLRLLNVAPVSTTYVAGSTKVVQSGKTTVAPDVITTQGLVVKPVGTSTSEIIFRFRVKGSPAVPRFNYQKGDMELLLGQNRSTQDGWRDPINAHIGDTIAIMMFAHNGTPNTVATNTFALVDLPTTPSQNLTVRGFLGSTECQAIMDTVVDGKVVGKSGLTVNIADGPAYLEYIQGSAQMFRPSSIAYTKLNDAIVSANGTHIGDVEGQDGDIRFIQIQCVVRPATSAGQLDVTIQ